MPDCAHCNRPLGRYNARTDQGCEQCSTDGASLIEFDADELGLDPETHDVMVAERAIDTRRKLRA